MAATSFLLPQYITNFHCIGSACEDNCCTGWTVSLDKKTYLKYRSIRDAGFQQTLPQRIKRVKGTDASDGNYAHLLLQKNGSCCYLQQNGLCAIQLQFGAGYLSNICRRYPRQALQLIDDVVECSLTMSCPEAVRIALFNEEPMQFIQCTKEELPPDIADATRRMGDYTKTAAEKAGPFAWAARDGCIDIMQSRRYSIAERLLLIGMLLRKLGEVPQEEFPQTINTYLALANSDQFEGQLASFPYNDGTRRLMELQLLLLPITRNTPVFHGFIQTVLRGLGVEKQSDVTVGELLDASYELVKQNEHMFHTFSKEKAHVLENYFVSYLFSSPFPFQYLAEGVSMYHHFVLLAEQYSMLRMLLSGTAENGAITDAQAVRCITALVRLNQHNTETPGRIVRNYIHNGQDDLAHLSFLLRE